MLSKEQNEILTRVGPGTPMGNLLREFWTPAIRSARLEKDGPPQRVRLFGQDFVAFRDSNGKVGFLDEGCPHRGVSLALGRNEECGLRCIFHGWKINVEGEVVEIPSEPVGSNLASKVRVNHYPTQEAGGVVWVWLGKSEKRPQFPAFDFVNYPPENIVARKAIIPCNWVQLLEGALDSSHVSSLHQSWLTHGSNMMSGPHPGVMGALSVKYEINDRPYGYMANARRLLPGGIQVNRKTEFILPWFTMIPTTLKTLKGVLAVVPIDDENTHFWDFSWDTAGPIDVATIDKLRNSGKRSPDLDNYFQPRFGADKVWGQDREMMKEGHYTGFIALSFEDYAVQESQGTIADRSKEHLGTSDVAIIRMRRIMLDMARDFQQGKLPDILTNQLDYEKLHPVHEVIVPDGKTITPVT
jgi:phthalate 4,5-dioxygenase